VFQEIHALRHPPANATGSPITYMSGGKQYIVFPVGGGPLVEELIAVAR
jgi:quinoprotein glucose dehydrogenase